VITFFGDPIIDYIIEYPNMTNVTYNLDGSYSIASFIAGVSQTQNYPAP
jgi:hypothetical protein